MSPGAVDRGARGTDASVARRPLHGRDRARLPRTRADHRATDRPRETNSYRCARSVRGPRGKRPRGSPRVGARGDLSRLQRGLLGDRRRRLDAAGPLPGCAPPRPPRRGAAPARAGGPWPRCPHGDPSVAHEGAGGTCRRADPPPRSEPRAVGPASHPSRVRRARTRGGARGRAWTLRVAGGDRRLSCSSAHRRGNGLGPDRGALRRARAARTLTGRGAEPRGCLRDGVRSCGGPRARRRPRGGAFTPLLPPPAERAIRDHGVIGADLAWFGHLQQLTYRRLAARPEWRGPVLAALPSDIRGAATANADATADLRAMVVPGPNLPTTWRIVEPAPLDDLSRYYREAETEFGIPWSYLAAIHLVETRMGRIRGTSVAGAQGPMQFMPATWAR